MGQHFCNYFPVWKENRGYRSEWTEDVKFKQRTVLTQNPSAEREPKLELFWWLSSHHLLHPTHQGAHSCSAGIRRHVAQAMPLRMHCPTLGRARYSKHTSTPVLPQQVTALTALTGKIGSKKASTMRLRSIMLSTSRKHSLDSPWKLQASCRQGHAAPARRSVLSVIAEQGGSGSYSKGRTCFISTLPPIQLDCLLT